jgi:hypothetical protein
VRRNVHETVLLVGAVGSLFRLYTHHSSAQAMSLEEEVVRNTYAKLSFMCKFVLLPDAAFGRNSNGSDGPPRSDLTALHTEIGPAAKLLREKTGQATAIRRVMKSRAPACLFTRVQCLSDATPIGFIVFKRKHYSETSAKALS